MTAGIEERRCAADARNVSVHDPTTCDEAGRGCGGGRDSAVAISRTLGEADGLTARLASYVRGSIYLIGGGGKTTLMYRLARGLNAIGEKVITTTSTKILADRAEAEGRLEVCSDVSRLLSRMEGAQEMHLAAARSRVRAFHEERASRGSPVEKLVGFSTVELDRIHAARPEATMIVEADGAAGRSLKAHGEHEPVVSRQADLVLAVVGADCVGCPLDARFVHRAELFSERLGLQMGVPVEANHVAGIILHDGGYLRAVSPSTKVVVVVTKIDSGERREVARALVERLKERDCEGRLDDIVCIDSAGALLDGGFS